MKRQALFSCLTCTPEGNAGICTACTLSCHEGHEILELGTKRNFRCDCGNSKFGNFFYKLLASKDVENVENLYNHNFKGTYCTCDQQNPDPDVEGEEEMVYCCIGEDLFHKEHLGLELSETQIDWRDHLCRCQMCSEFYQKRNIAFLLDKDDSVAEYEDQAKQRRVEWLKQQEQNSLNIFNNLGHVQKVEFFSGIDQEMKNEIINFLASHDRSKHVTAADVYQMFENLKNKRSRQI